MKYTHFDDILPNHRTDFVMLYFAACRSLRELQAAIRRTNGGKLTCRQAWLLRRIQNKFVQMVARLKATQRNEIPNIPNAKYPTGIIIDLKSPQGNVFYLMGLANRLIRELGLSSEEIAEFKREQASATTYQAHLAILCKWFGIVFVDN
ncbi:MAG: hypothetical protein IKP24_00280 [Alphaproteobacteria bacterium]|nr:hypothetical protein [Alphaproteobacteria bacterium]